MEVGVESSGGGNFLLVRWFRISLFLSFSFFSFFSVFAIWVLYWHSLCAALMRR